MKVDEKEIKTSQTVITTEVTCSIVRLGIIYMLPKEWIATSDARTRDSHSHLDGVRIPWDEKFPNGLKCPGDPEGDPAEVYNCRCTMARVPLGEALVNGNTVQSYEDWKEGKEAQIGGKSIGIGDKLIYNEKADFSINVPGYNDKILNALSDSSSRVAKRSSETGHEHYELINLKNGNVEYTDEGDDLSIGNKYLSIIKSKPGNSYALVHSHLFEGGFSEYDIYALASKNSLDMFVATQIDGVRYVIEQNKSEDRNGKMLDLIFPDEIEKLRKDYKTGVIKPEEWGLEREKRLVKRAIEKFTKGLVVLK